MYNKLRFEKNTLIYEYSYKNKALLCQNYENKLINGRETNILLTLVYKLCN